MANQLILLKKIFTDEQQAVTVADRYPQDVLRNIRMSFVNW